MLLKVIHKITALFLTFVLLANNINNVVIVSDFVINQDVIAKTLCIQKEEQKGCMGKCQLKKELVKNNTNTNQDAPVPNNDRTRLDVFVVYTSPIHINKEFLSITTTNHTRDFRQKQLSSGYYSILLPPPDLS
jgi:hypothetical protein